MNGKRSAFAAVPDLMFALLVTVSLVRLWNCLCWQPCAYDRITPAVIFSIAALPFVRYWLNIFS